MGMVGAGQLARMTCQAAIGLGLGFRVLAGSAAESAAQVCADVRVGDYTGWLTCSHSPPGATWSPSTMSTCRTSTWPRWRRRWRSGPGADALRYTQDKLAMRERLARRSACRAPATRRSPTWPG